MGLEYRHPETLFLSQNSEPISFFPFYPKSSAYLAVPGGTTFGHENTGIPPFSLGGGLQLSAFGENELITNQYYLFQTGYRRRFG